MSRRAAGWVEFAAAWAVAGWMVWFWPSSGLGMVGAEQWWVGAGIILVLGGAGLLEAMGWIAQDQPQELHLLTPGVCRWAAFGLMGLGMAGVGLGRWVGNYKLWVAVGYLLGLNMRIAGVVVGLRPEMFRATRPRPRLLVLGAAAAAGLQLATGLWLAGLLPEQWPPSWDVAWRLVVRAGLWGVVCGGLAAMVQRPGAGRRGWWMGYTAMAFGPGPVFSAICIPLGWLGVMGAVGAGMGAWAWLKPPGARQGPATEAGGYWLMRAMMLLWWGVGIALAVAGGWWQHHLPELVLEAKWIRAVVVGGVLVSCLGLLVEYSMPLFGRAPELSLPVGQRKVLGMVLSAGAVVAALGPLTMVDLGPPPLYRPPVAPRAVVLEKEVVLEEGAQVRLPVPSWLRGVSRIYVVSHLEGEGDLVECEPVAKLVASDMQGRIYVFALRAGVDTAHRDLARMAPAPAPAYERPRIYASWMVYTPAGQPFYAHDYITGVYLGHQVEALKEISIARVGNQPGLRMVLKRVMVY